MGLDKDPQVQNVQGTGIEEAVQNIGKLMIRPVQHDGSAADLTLDQPFVRHLSEDLAHRIARHAVLGCQRSFVWYQLARLPFATFQTLLQIGSQSRGFFDRHIVSFYVIQFCKGSHNENQFR